MNRRDKIFWSLLIAAFIVVHFLIWSPSASAQEVRSPVTIKSCVGSSCPPSTPSNSSVVDVITYTDDNDNTYEYHIFCKNPGAYGVPSDMQFAGYDINSWIQDGNKPYAGECIYIPSQCSFPFVGTAGSCTCPNGTHPDEAPRQAHEVTNSGGVTQCVETSVCEDGQQVVGAGAAACDIPPDSCGPNDFYDSQTAECYSGPNDTDDGDDDDSSSSSSDSSSSSGNDSSSGDGSDDGGDGNSSDGDDTNNSSASGSSSSQGNGSGQCPEGQELQGTLNGQPVCAGGCPSGQSWGAVNGVYGCYGAGDCDPETQQCEDGGDAVGGGQSCDAPPTCEGDALMCAQIQQQWLLRCDGSGDEHDFDLPEDSGDVGFQQTLTDFQTRVGESDVAQGIENFLSVGSGGSCPVWDVSVWEFNVVIDQFCSESIPWGMIAGIIIGVASLVGFRIAFG